MTMSNKQLILALIKDDLINSCLITRLNKAGLDAGAYFLDLSDTVFDLFGFEDNERTEIIYKRYLKMTRRATPTVVKDRNKKLNSLALEIYFYLRSKAPKK